MGNLLYFCDVWKGRLYVTASVSVSSIFNNGQFYLKRYFLCQKFPLEMSIATSLLSIFFHQNTKSTTGLNIYSILEERS